MALASVRYRLASILLLVAILAPRAFAEDPPLPSASPADWNQWLGPTRDNHFHGPAWPDRIDDEHLRPVWRVDLGPGFGGPLVAGDRIFTVETKDKHFEVARAFDRATGNQLWGARWEGAIEVPAIAKGQGDWIKSTPAWDGESLYVVGMEDTFAAIAGDDGAVRWRIDFKQHYGTGQPEYGNPSSPLVYKDWVYVFGAGRLNRIERETGVIDWNGLDTGNAVRSTPFSSPVVATIAGREQLVAFIPKSMAAIDPDTCEILWQIPVGTAIDAAYPTPLVHNDDIFLSLYGRKTQMFRVSKGEDGAWRCEPVWENKAKGYLSTPVLVDGRAYVQLTNRRVVCIDLATGNDAWGSTERFGLYWGMTANRDKILALDDQGTLRLIRADAEKLNIVDTRKIGDVKSWAPIAFSGNEVYVRDIEGLSKYRWE